MNRIWQIQWHAAPKTTIQKDGGFCLEHWFSDQSLWASQQPCGEVPWESSLASLLAPVSNHVIELGVDPSAFVEP